MTGGKALDTGIWVEYLRGDAGIQEHVRNTERLLLPFAVLGELLLGAERSHDPSKQRSLVDAIAEACVLILPTANVCRRYAEVKSALWSKGKPIPENDIWIAACALESGVELVARDAHFHEVEGLQIAVW